MDSLSSMRVKNRIKKNEVLSGDHIYTWRPLFVYSHHGIYIGDGLVIHFSAPPGKLKATILSFSPRLSSLSSAPGAPPKTCPNNRQRCRSSGKPGSGVAYSCLDCFIGKGSLYRYVYGVTEFQSRHQLRGGTCTTHQSEPESTVLQRTNYLFENGFGNYNLVKNNCEDFAFYCKTGILTLDDKGSQISGQIAYLARMFPKTAEKYFSISKEAVEARLRNNGTEVIKVPVEDMDKFHRDGQSDANGKAIVYKK